MPKFSVAARFPDQEARECHDNHQLAERMQPADYETAKEQANILTLMEVLVDDLIEFSAEFISET